jgi:hypothetical protein
MTFVSLEFLAILAVTLPLYFVLTRCYQNYLLLASSLIFMDGGTTVDNLVLHADWI